MPTALPPWAPLAKPALTVAFLTALWTWEALFPLVAGRRGRLRHGVRNLLIAVANTVVLSAVFGAATVGVAQWAAEERFGLLNVLGVPWPWRMVPAVLLLDLWLYVWHRLNHRVPLLWRFHRMHHADAEMDVTTATRFHLGEHLGAATLRLGLIPLFGVSVFEILIFETLVVSNTMFHHANVSVGRFDRPLRRLIVTPAMHHVHHSRVRAETDSNYSTLFSFWDRAFGSFRERPDGDVVRYGLDEFDGERWQTVRGMLVTPFVGGGSRADGGSHGTRGKTRKGGRDGRTRHPLTPGPSPQGEGGRAP